MKGEKYSKRMSLTCDMFRNESVSHHDQEIKDLHDVLYAMELRYTERESDAQQEFQSLVDELKNKVFHTSYMYLYKILIHRTLKKLTLSALRERLHLMNYGTHFKRYTVLECYSTRITLLGNKTIQGEHRGKETEV